ncbi:MAG: M24 family metallopeptidase [bacterium]|nr:M24 family metallopeptidase [bacterium]
MQASLNPGQALLITTPSHIHYLTGFVFLLSEEREGILVLTQKKAYLLHAHFSPLPSDTCLVPLIGVYPAAIKEHLVTLSKKHSLKELLIDTKQLMVEEYLLLEELKIPLQPYNHAPLWKLRTIKDASEITHIRQAGAIAAQTWNRVERSLHVSITEKELQTIIDQTMAELGSERPAFPTIVAFGAHAALPHHQPTDTILGENTAVLFDFGARINGYRSDMSRTIWFGPQPTPTYLKVEETVKTAYNQVLAAIEQARQTDQPMLASTLDQAARSPIEAAGYGKNFIHTTGHGVGLDIHEPPSLHHKNTSIVQVNSVVTVEPGVYLEGELGYRHENTLLITETGYEVLTEPE